MITILGAILGFFSSIAPRAMDIFQDYRDKKHEIDVLRIQMEFAATQQAWRMEEIDSRADIEESKALYRHDSAMSGVKWIDAMRASIRPILTYTFFFLFLFLEIVIIMNVLNNGGDIFNAFSLIWDNDVKAIFAAILSFWFGNRAMEKARGWYRG